jgi:hypothetical protein
MEMSEFIKMDVFFFITSIAVLGVTVGVCFVLWRVARLIARIESILTKVTMRNVLHSMKKSSGGMTLAEEVGAGLAVAAVVGAAGYYFYGSKKAKQHRKIVTDWADDMKNEVIKESKRLQDFGPEAIATIVDSVAKTYRDLKNISAAELEKASTELKTNWKKIKTEASKSK